MIPLEQAVTDFLGQSRIAVAGVSRDPNQAANAIFRKLKQHGYTVFPVNPAAEEAEGEPCYPSIKEIPGGVTAVLIATSPQATLNVMHDCAEIGVHRTWLHRSFGAGSFNEEAISYGRTHHITVIPGGCPMMYLEPDVGHRCMRWILDKTGKLPKQVTVPTHTTVDA